MIRSHLSDRDEAIVQAINDFSQLTSNQIQRLFFADGSEKCRADRARKALKRLKKWQEVIRIEERAIGGWASGSHGYVYMPPNPDVRQYRQIRDPHTLAIAEFYVCLVEAERRGLIQIADYELESKVRGLEPIPDLYMHLKRSGLHATFCIEIDKSTESRQRIEQKLRGYIKSYDTWHGEEFPQILFAVSTPRQLTMIKKAIASCQLPQLFTAADFDSAVSLLTN